MRIAQKYVLTILSGQTKLEALYLMSELMQNWSIRLITCSYNQVKAISLRATPHDIDGRMRVAVGVVLLSLL